MQIAAELPLMYALGRRSEHPEVRFPTEAPQISSQPQRVRQPLLEQRPFLQSIPVYRYARDLRRH
jgi:hypothetical protein